MKITFNNFLNVFHSDCGVNNNDDNIIKINHNYHWESDPRAASDSKPLVAAIPFGTRIFGWSLFVVLKERKL